MNLISFDIGIKNMAYCIFSRDLSNQLFIKDWNILNLMDTQETIPTCTCKNKPKTKKSVETPCFKLAKYQKNNVFFCEKHAKNSGIMLPNKKNTLVQLKKLKNEELLKLGNSHMIFLNVENPEKLKKKELLEKIDAFFKSHSLETIIKLKQKTANETDLIKIGKNMKNCLNEVLQNINITDAIIENQISPIANRMKTIQGMLAQYFIMKNENIHIEFVSSSNKLKQFIPFKNSITTVDELSSKSKKTQGEIYKKHKIDGVYYCSQIISKNSTFEIWKDSLDNKKKDDLADSFLQGLWYLKHKNIINYAEDLKINIV
jgi:hypothetical protein